MHRNIAKVAIYHIPVFPNVYTVNTINLAVDIFYDCNKTHDTIVSTDITSLWKFYRFVTRVYLRAFTCMHYACGYIGGAHFESNSLSASHALAASDSRVNCKVSGCREIWEPRAAAGIRAIHRMQICTGAFLGGGDYPHIHRGIQPLPLWFSLRPYLPSAMQRDYTERVVLMKHLKFCWIQI